MKEFISHSPHETEEFAAKFAGGISPGSVICLFGELGSGKTVFARGLARGLGIVEPVQSPTFVIACEYAVRRKGCPIRFLFHLDLYRIENSRSALVFGIEEYLRPADGVSVIEWAERIEDIVPHSAVKVRFRHIAEDSRGITVFMESAQARSK